MEKDKIMEKVERWRLLADVFIKNNSKVFIKTITGDLHFCIIILSGEDSITVNNFAPEQRAGQRDRIYWLEIQEFEEYKEKEEKEEDET